MSNSATRLRTGQESLAWMANLAVPSKAIVLFTRHLASLFASGVPLLKALDCLIEQEENVNFTEALWTIRNSVSNGSSLSESFAQFPRVFSNVYIHILRVGETTGRLVSCLELLARWSERDSQLFHRIVAALVYPACVLVVAGILMGGIFVFVFPPFLQMLHDMHIPAPWYTRLMSSLVFALGHPGCWIFLICISALLVLLWTERKDEPEARKRFWNFLQKVPSLGRALTVCTLARYAWAASIMTDTGCEQETTWRLAAAASQNPLFEEDCDALVRSVYNGSSAAEHMRLRPQLYPSSLSSLLRAGEESGKTPMLLRLSARVLEEELDIALATLVALFEPLLLAAVAGVVVVSILSIFVPLYSYLNAA